MAVSASLKFHLKYSLLLGVLLVQCGCSPTLDIRGHHKDDLQIEKLKVKKMSAEDVAAAFGSPTMVQKNEKNQVIWYYISKKVETKSFFSPQIVEQKIIKLTFDKNNLLIRSEDLSHIKPEDIKPAKDQTQIDRKDDTLPNSVADTFSRMWGIKKRKKLDSDES